MKNSEEAAKVQRDCAVRATAGAVEKRGITADRRREAEKQTRIAVEQGQVAADALAATQRELLRAQTAELRAFGLAWPTGSRPPPAGCRS